MSFQLKLYKKETENKTIRFPIPLIEQIDKAIENQDATFSRFVIHACTYALENIDVSLCNSILSLPISLHFLYGLCVIFRRHIVGLIPLKKCVFLIMHSSYIQKI